MKKLTKLEKYGLIAAILVGGSFFYLKKVYDPEAASLQRAIGTLNKTVATYNQLSEPPPLAPLRRQAETLAGELAEATARLREAGGRTGQAAEVTEVLHLINRVAGDQRIEILQIVPGKQIEEELFTWEVFGLTMRCRYQDLVALMGSMKRLKEPIQVRNLEIVREPAEGGFVIVTMKLLV
ncbi:type 4a pilus biogenesis protein PilO [Desulfofustis glycolicus]|uniref:Pilus assembly protein, PilO n=1 Tax=Desulfofustis glycolicus DSM 9705 TaxID=1121409 RepID=A0A1M5YMV3_9BACT|nr:type 4a pilus biogenesis protein PilO [Desulfofustis glycolicus]SHI13301.1 Pilus assembly protein, PilO [Desulfofustis glycolicus DSM 9705]